ncbi:MAG TPA: glycosyltransferase [Steroidobacteraceae bacterium]|jgi:glycosyltransferase involved in cell wall biosynthesis
MGLPRVGEKSPRRLLILLPTLSGGGSERVVVTLLRHMDRSLFRLNLLVVDGSPGAYGADIPPDVDVRHLGNPRILSALPRIIMTIWRERPDVVFSTLSHLNLALAAVRPILPRRMRLVARESSIVTQVIAGYRRPGWWAMAYRHFYRRLDRLVCQSRYMRDELVERYGYPIDKSVVINNPVDAERIRELAGAKAADSPERDPARIELLAVGRLSWEKGFDLLIDALALCRRPALRLTILGEGPLRGDLALRARDQGVEGQVTFAGFQSNPYPFFAKADALVVSSRYEGFPNVVLEALACGTPVIATRSPGGTAEILENVPGCVLVADVSAQSLATAIAGFSGEVRVPDDAIRPYEVATIVRRYEQELT